MPRLLTRDNIKLALVAMACLTIAWTGPAVAHGVHAKFAHNADKVDGKHAVGAGASLAKAKGKLVAHDRRGQLPARFIPNSFVTEAEFNARLGTRVIAAGTVAADGTKADNHAAVGQWTPSRTSGGQYKVAFRNRAMCPVSGGATLPTVTVSPVHYDAVPYAGGSTCHHPTGNIEVHIVTQSMDGGSSDRSFSFAIYGQG